MRDVVSRAVNQIDSKFNLLNLIRERNPSFYNEFVREFLTDPLTFVGFEKDLVEALQAVSAIMVYRDEDSIWVRYKLSGGGVLDEKFPDYESAFEFAIGLLHIK